MRKLWIRKRAASTMIAGIIILTIFLTASVTMVIIGQQYDKFQATVSRMQQRETDMYSENILGAFPGLYNGTDRQVLNCGGGTCNNYTLVLDNLGIGTQIARIYINSSVAPGCVTPCVLDPANTATPYKFRASDSYVNTGEYYHNIVFWLPASIFLPSACGGDNTGCNTIKLVTTRGRIFMFLYPLPIISGAGGEQGGTGIYIGPLVITFQKKLITYTSTQRINPEIPIGGQNGYWVIPTGTVGLVLYIKIQTDEKAVSDVYLTAQSVFEIARYTSPSVLKFFFVIAPLDQAWCNSQFRAQDSTINCYTQYGYRTGGSSGLGTDGTYPLKPYQPCNVPPSQYNTLTCTTQLSVGSRYTIPKPTVSGQRGDPVVVAFAADDVGTSDPLNVPTSWNGLSVTSFLGLSFVYDNGTGAYVYGVTLPFIALCVNEGNPPPSCQV